LEFGLCISNPGLLKNVLRSSEQNDLWFIPIWNIVKYLLGIMGKGWEIQQRKAWCCCGKKVRNLVK
jgi:hypothetical protein